MTHTHFLDPDSLAPWPPLFEEDTHDIPSGYGIEHSADGGFYPYEIDISDPSRIGRLKDTCGLNMRCGDRDEAVAVLMLEVLA